MMAKERQLSIKQMMGVDSLCTCRHSFSTVLHQQHGTYTCGFQHVVDPILCSMCAQCDCATSASMVEEEKLLLSPLEPLIGFRKRRDTKRFAMSVPCVF